MRFAIDLPDDIGESLNEKWPDLSRYATEILAVEGYRSGLLTAEQLHRMLSLKTRLEIDAFLKEHGIPVGPWKKDSGNDLKALQQSPAKQSIVP